MPDDVIKETNRQIVFYPRIHKKKGWQSWFAKEGMDGGHGGKKPSRAVLGGGAAKAKRRCFPICAKEGRQTSTEGWTNESFIAGGSAMEKEMPDNASHCILNLKKHIAD